MFISEQEVSGLQQSGLAPASVEGSLSEPECPFVNSMSGTTDHSCDPSAREAETGGFLRVPGQAGIHIE